MNTELKINLKNSIAGFIVGFIWESLGAMFFWRLAEPENILFLFALISWSILGLIFGYVLQQTRPSLRPAVKLAIGMCGLVAGKITLELGLIYYGDLSPKVGGVPLVMIVGWLTLAFVLDFLNSK
jgi:hypothetical protein